MLSLNSVDFYKIKYKYGKQQSDAKQLRAGGMKLRERGGTYSWNKNVLDFVGAPSLPKGNLSEIRAEGVGSEEYQILQRENRTISVSTLMLELCIFLVRIQNVN